MIHQPFSSLHQPQQQVAVVLLWSTPRNSSCPVVVDHAV